MTVSASHKGRLSNLLEVVGPQNPTATVATVGPEVDARTNQIHEGSCTMVGSRGCH